MEPNGPAANPNPKMRRVASLTARVNPPVEAVR